MDGNEEKLCEVLYIVLKVNFYEKSRFMGVVAGKNLGEEILCGN